jgi:HrpA-like RNA helicase
MATIFDKITIYKNHHLIDVDEKTNEMTPLDYIKSCIQKLLLKPANKRVILINASTGTGKTTFLPAELFLDYDLNSKLDPLSVVCCVPKVLVALSVYEFVPKIFARIKAGINMGVSTGTYKSEQGKPFMIMSIGTMTEIFKSIIRNANSDNPNMKDINLFKIIIIDEAHKHTLELDLLLALLKQYINNPKIPDRHKPFIVIMSATLDYDRYMEYFDLPTITNTSEKLIGGTQDNGNFMSMSATIYTGGANTTQNNPHLVKIIGSVSFRDDFYIKKNEPNIIDLLYKEITQKVTDSKFEYGNMLVFLPTKSYIKQLKAILVNWAIEHKFPILPIALTSEEIINDTYEYKRYKQNVKNITMFGNPDKKVIKVYICTNVAEEGTTFDNLRYVYDSGYHNYVEYNPHYFSTVVLIRPINIMSNTQRIGRAGRDVSGESLSLFKKDVKKILSITDVSDYQVTDFASQYLNLINSGIAFKELIYPPPNELIFSIEDKLFLLGFIDTNNKITEIGKLANQININNIELTKMILCGYAYDVSISDLITIAAVSSYSVKTNLYVNDQLISAACRFLLYMFGRSNDFKTVTREKNYLIDGSTVLIKESDITRIIDIRYRIIKEFQNAKIPINNVRSEMYKFYEYELMETQISSNNLSEHKDFLETLSKYKRCIYEGFKNNLLMREVCDINREIFYKDLRGNRINVNSFYNARSTHLMSNVGINTCFYPLFIVTNKFTIRKDINRYVMEGGVFSAMDGFVNIDDKFISKYTKKINNNVVMSDNDFNLYYNLCIRSKYTFEHAVIETNNPCISTFKKPEYNEKNINNDKIGNYVEIIQTH